MVISKLTRDNKLRDYQNRVNDIKSIGNAIGGSITQSCKIANIEVRDYYSAVEYLKKHEGNFSSESAETNVTRTSKRMNNTVLPSIELVTHSKSHKGSGDADKNQSTLFTDTKGNSYNINSKSTTHTEIKQNNSDIDNKPRSTTQMKPKENSNDDDKLRRKREEMKYNLMQNIQNNPVKSLGIMKN